MRTVGWFRLLRVALLLLLHGVASAGIVPQSVREELFSRALEGFWGRAQMPDGKLILPASEDERRVLPVSNNVANDAFDRGELSGLAEWCGLDWKANFRALTRNARQNGQSEKQVAFISVLHGVAQGTVASAMARAGPCQPPEREKVRAQLAGLLAREAK